MDQVTGLPQKLQLYQHENKENKTTTSTLNTVVLLSHHGKLVESCSLEASKKAHLFMANKDLRYHIGDFLTLSDIASLTMIDKQYHAYWLPWMQHITLQINQQWDSPSDRIHEVLTFLDKVIKDLSSYQKNKKSLVLQSLPYILLSLTSIHCKLYVKAHCQKEAIQVITKKTILLWETVVKDSALFLMHMLFWNPFFREGRYIKNIKNEYKIVVPIFNSVARIAKKAKHNDVLSMCYERWYWSDDIILALAQNQYTNVEILGKIVVKTITEIASTVKFILDENELFDFLNNSSLNTSKAIIENKSVIQKSRSSLINALLDAYDKTKNRAKNIGLLRDFIVKTIHPKYVNKPDLLTHMAHDPQCFANQLVIANNLQSNQQTIDAIAIWVSHQLTVFISLSAKDKKTLSDIIQAIKSHSKTPATIDCLVALQKILQEMDQLTQVSDHFFQCKKSANTSIDLNKENDYIQIKQYIPVKNHFSVLFYFASIFVTL